MDDELRQRLLALAAEDARVRAELAADGSLYQGYHPSMQAVHEKNKEALEAILAEGWPGVSRVGSDGEEAAWLIAQHAIGSPDFQRHCLVLLEKAVAEREAPPWQAALLTDRIRTLGGRGQIYGTQFDWDARGKLSPLPIEAPETVDARRAAVGLGPLAEAIERQRREAARSGEPKPADYERRQREFEAWARRAGWR